MKKSLKLREKLGKCVENFIIKHHEQSKKCKKEQKKVARGEVGNWRRR